MSPLRRAEIEEILPAPGAVPAARRGRRPRARVAGRRAEGDPRRRVVPAGPLPGESDHAGVLMVEALAQTGAVAVLSEPSNQGQAGALCRHRRRPLQAHRPARRRSRARVRARADAGPGRQGVREGDGGRRARRAWHPNLCGGGRRPRTPDTMLGCVPDGVRIGITGVASVPCRRACSGTTSSPTRLGVTAGLDHRPERHLRATRRRRG